MTQVKRKDHHETAPPPPKPAPPPPPKPAARTPARAAACTPEAERQVGHAPTGAGALRSTAVEHDEGGDGKRTMTRDLIRGTIAELEQHPGEGAAERERSRETVAQLRALECGLEAHRPVRDTLRAYRAIIAEDAAVKTQAAQDRAGFWDGAAKTAEITRNTSIVLGGIVAAPIAVGAASATGATALALSATTAATTSYGLSKASSLASLGSAAVQGEAPTTRQFLAEVLDERRHLNNAAQAAVGSVLPLIGNSGAATLTQLGLSRPTAGILSHASVQGLAAIPSVLGQDGLSLQDKAGIVALRALSGVTGGAFNPQTVQAAVLPALLDVPTNLGETYVRNGGHVDGHDVYAATLNALVSPAMVRAMHSQGAPSSSAQAEAPGSPPQGLPGWAPDLTTPGQYRGRGSPVGALDVEARPVGSPSTPPGELRASPPSRAPSAPGPLGAPSTRGPDPVSRWISTELGTAVRQDRARAALLDALPPDFPAGSRADFGQVVHTLLPSLPGGGPARLRAAAEAWRQAHQDRPADARTLEGPLGAVLGKLELQAAQAAIAAEVAYARNRHGVPDARLGAVTKAVIDQQIDLMNAGLSQRAEPASMPLWKLDALLVLNAQAVAAEHVRSSADLDRLLSFKGQWGQIGHGAGEFEGGGVRVTGLGLWGPIGPSGAEPSRPRRFEPQVYFATGTHGDSYVPGAGVVDAQRLGLALLAGDRRGAQALLRPLVEANLPAFLRNDADLNRMHGKPVEQRRAFALDSRHGALHEIMRAEWNNFRRGLDTNLPMAFPRAKVEALVSLLKEIELTAVPTGAIPPNGGAPEPWFAPHQRRVGVPDAFLETFSRTLDPKQSSLFTVLLSMHESWHQVGSGMHAGNIDAVGRSGPALMKLEYRADQLSNLAAVLFEQQRSGAPDADLGKIARGVLDIGAKLTIAFDLQSRGLTEPAPVPEMADRRLSRFLTTSMLMVMTEHVRSREDLFALYGADPMWVEVVGARKGWDRGDPTTTGKGDAMHLVFEANGKAVVHLDDNARVGRILDAMMSFQFGVAAEELRPIIEQNRGTFMPFATGRP